MPTQTCPLCDQPASFREVSAPDGKMFECSACVEFFIDESSEEYLAHLQEVTRTEVRSKLQKSAKQSDSESLFVIRSPQPEERGGDGQRVARKMMTTEFVSRG